jgi:lipooligosaccharide transport system permease protein
MTTETVFSPQARAELNTIAGIRFRSISALWMRHWFAFIRFWKYALAFMFVEPVAMMIGVGVGIGRLVPNVPGTEIPYPEFVAPGIIVASAMFVPMVESSMGAYNRMENQLYDTQLTAPLSILEVLIADIAFGMTRAFISMVSITVIAVVFGWIDEWTVVFVIVPVTLVAILFGGVGFLFSSTAPHVNFVTLVFTVIGTPMFIFGGIFYPFEVLPSWAQTVSNFIPLAPAVNLSRAFSTNVYDASLVWDVLFLLGMILVVLPLAYVLLKRKLIK